MTLVWTEIRGLGVTAAWEDYSEDGSYPRSSAIHVRDAGFRGFVGESSTRLQELEGPRQYHEARDPWSYTGYDRDLDHGDNSAYEHAWHEKHGDGMPDHHDDVLHDFISEHTGNQVLWSSQATRGPVDLSRGVYATQSHIHPRHLERRAIPSSQPSDEAPKFVTHQGRLNVADGHHRVAAALLRGDRTVPGWHYDADRHGFPEVH